MNVDEFIKQVSHKDPFLDDLVSKVLAEQKFREMVNHLLLSSNDIMVYYHSYIILQRAAVLTPETFYPYWDQYSSLLKRENSYFRNYGMDLISTLISADVEERFKSITDDFYKQLDDEKISTRKYCILWTERIIDAKPELAEFVISKIIHSLRVNSNTEKHQNFLLSTFFDVISELVDKIKINSELRDFLNSVNENSPNKKIKKGINKIFDLYKLH